MEAQFKGKVAIVTGSSAGLGEAMALMFSSRGANVTICGRDEDRLRSVLDKAVMVSGGHKDRFISILGDITDHNVQKQIVDKTVEIFGRLDILVANAGIMGINESILESTEENFDTVMNTNLKSVYFLIQLAVPHLEKTGGNIVTISSPLSHVTQPNVYVYPISKAALDQLTRCLAVELGPKGIRVNSVSPGSFLTLFLRGQKEHIMEYVKDYIVESRKHQPLSQRVGLFEDVAEAVIFLASDNAGFITGEMITVDGGKYMTSCFYSAP